MHNEIGYFKTFGRTLGCLHLTQSKADQCWSKNCHFSSRSFETKDFKYKQKIPPKDRDWDQTVNIVTCETLASRSSALINDKASLFSCCIHAPFLFLTKPWVCPDRHPLSLVPTRQRGSQDPPCTSKGLISREHASRASYWPSTAHYLSQTKLTKGKESRSSPRRWTEKDVPWLLPAFWPWGKQLKNKARMSRMAWWRSDPKDKGPLRHPWAMPPTYC